MLVSTMRAFVGAQLAQQARDRTSLFFMLVLPLAIMLIIGTTFGSVQTLEIAVVGPDDAVTASIVEELGALDDVTADRRDDLAEVQADLRRFDIEGAVIRNDDGTYGFLANEASTGGFAARTAAQRVVDRIEAGVANNPTIPVLVETVGDDRLAGQGPFALTSAQNLVLFVFITSLTAAAILVRAKKSGILRRSLSAPVTSTAVILGVGAGWMVLALVQAAIIIAAGGLAFGVDWGDPLGAVALVLVFSLVGTAAGILLGAVFSSEQTVGSASPPIALVLAAIGGCMVPSEVFPPVLLTLSKFTPHYWALEGWKKLMFDGASLVDIAPNLGVLLAFAAALFVLAGTSLRQALTAN